jgi:hypothetical protein
MIAGLGVYFVVRERPMSANEIMIKGGMDTTCFRDNRPPMSIFLEDTPLWRSIVSAQKERKSELMRYPPGLTRRSNVELKIKILSNGFNGEQIGRVVEIGTLGVPDQIMHKDLVIEYGLCFVPGELGRVGHVIGSLIDKENSSQVFRPEPE